MSIFKAYDIRGIWGQTIDAALTYRIGCACTGLLEGKTFLLGYDARTHSKLMCDAFAGGLRDQGRSSTRLGLCSTPQLHFVQHRNRFDAAAMITASHNPPSYHGIKLYDRDGGPVSYGRGLEKLEKEVERMGSGSQSWTPFENTDEAFVDKALSDYIDFLCAASRGMKLSQRVVVDASNGSAGKVFERLCEALDIDAVLINLDPDGRFPNHDPNPLEEASRKQVSSKVVQERADVGVLLDGDGDRIIFFDNRGEVIENYFLSALLAEEVLRLHPGGAIVYDLISSRVLPERISELKGKPVISRVGYTFIHENMVSTGAAFGAETSGHVYFKVSDDYYTESAAYALVFLLKVLSRKGKPLAELVEPLRRRYFQAPETNLSVDDKQRALELVEARFSDGVIEKIDGISIFYDDFWFNLRPSNTEPLMRLRLEASRREIAESRIAEIVELIADA